ncbi:MAG: hypothetical protein Q9190_007137 [Brigantiaea leucoxantha]
MCRKTSLEAYAEDICSAAKAISGWCVLEGIPQPSFDPQAPAITIPPTAPQSVLNARQQLITASTKVQLRSVARMAMTSNFLCEPELDKIAHNAVSSQFVTNPGLLDWALFMTQFSMPTAAKMVEATERWGATEKKNETAVNISFDTELPLFDFIKKSPEMTKQFAAYMKNVTASEGTNIRHLLTGFDWASLGEATVVDVGGSTCSASIALANAFPKLRFVVQDLPDTIADTRTYLSPQPESVRSRITTQGHNFFTPEKYKGADVYLLRMILHDWPAAEATNILKNLLDALKANPKTRLLIMDTVLPVPGSIGATEEALLRVRDLTMIQAFNSKERELGEFTDLFDKASDGEGKLVLKNTIKPPGSVMSVMEVAYQPNNPAPAAAKANGVLTNGTYTNGACLNGSAMNSPLTNGHLTNADDASAQDHSAAARADEKVEICDLGTSKQDLRLFDDPVNSNSTSSGELQIT